MVVTNFRIMSIDHEKNKLDILHVLPNIDDVIVMNTHRVSQSVGYGFYGARYTTRACCKDRRVTISRSSGRMVCEDFID